MANIVLMEDEAWAAELAQQIRAMPRYRFTPILFTTVLAGEELGAYREIKCCDFLVKPFTEEQFRTAVTSALELSRRMERLPAAAGLARRKPQGHGGIGHPAYASGAGFD